MDRFVAQITGITPLLMHRDDVVAADQIAAARDAIKSANKKGGTGGSVEVFRAGDDRVPADTWKTYLYHDEQQVCLPADNLRRCLIMAGAKLSAGTKNKGETLKKIVPFAILFDDVFSPVLVSGKPIPMDAIRQAGGAFADQAEAVRALGFRLNVKRAAVGQSKHVRVRPEFMPWSLVVPYTIGDDRLKAKPDVVSELWDLAGHAIGLGDFRPSSPKSPGPYGRFSVEVKRA